MANKIKILLISTVVNKSIVRAIEDVKDYADVKLIFTHDIGKYNLQELIDWADIVLIDVRGDALALTELDYKDKDVIALVGGSSLFSIAKLGSFKMSRVKGANMSYGGNPESVKKWINRMQKIIETTEEEKEIARRINEVDNWLLSLREKIRLGERLSHKDISLMVKG